MGCYSGNCGSCGYHGGGAGGGAGGGVSYSVAPAISYNSGLESIMGWYSINHSEVEVRGEAGFSFGSDFGAIRGYEIKNNTEYSARQDISKSYSFIPEQFLNPFRPDTIFVNCPEQVEEYVRETFRLLMDKEIPKNITLKICPVQEMRKIHEENSGKWNDGIMGFSINRNKVNGVNEIFVKEGKLDALMLTLGHEIGHVLSMPLDDKMKEEAKAFAFELAWIKTMHENNIAGLAANIDTSVLLKPAKNGLHDVAFDMVRNLVINGKKAIEVFFEIVNTGILDRRIGEKDVF